MGKIMRYSLRRLNISTILLFWAALAILSGCSESTQNLSNEPHAAQAPAHKTADIRYTQYPLAYVQEGELFFHSAVDDKKVKFVEESAAIFNFTFDTAGQTLYYSVERDNTLWLKSADISAAEVTPQWVVDWQLKKDDCITATYAEASPLLYSQGTLLIQHDFSWDYYGFKSMAIYSIAKNTVNHKEYDQSVIDSYSGELAFDKVDQYFQTRNQQLYYTGNKAPVSLTDSLDFSALRLKGNEDFKVDTDFTAFIFAPDKTKILFAIMLEFGDLAHGPYCIANANGSQQMLLKDTDIASSRKPVWLKNNSVAFIDNDENLFVANNDESTIVKVAENISSFVAR